ncbi:tetratricopeptide repeat protein [Methanobrevibacter sp.]|uniref:tetratricopeptide repeat protein n=1 Tax=Methanobrevibacter sp. TaxID=66852 RepID=UPI00388F6B1C
MLKDYIECKIREAYEYMQNDTQKALEIFDEILEIEPECIDALNGKASTLMKLDKFEESEKYYNKSLSVRQNSSAFLNLGIISKHQNDFNQAIEYYDKALKLNPHLENIVKILKDEINEKNDVIDLDKFSREARKHIKKGIELKDENRLWDSLDEFMKAIEEDSECKKEVNIMIEDIKRTFEKEFIYEDSEFNINSKIDRIKMQALKALIKDNNPEKALTLMDLVLEIDENDVNILNHKGGVLFICNKNQEAIDCFDRCINIDKNYKCVLFNKGIVLRVMNRLPEALTCFDELLKIPQNYNKVKPYQLEILNKLHNQSTNKN